MIVFIFGMPWTGRSGKRRGGGAMSGSGRDTLIGSLDEETPREAGGGPPAEPAGSMHQPSLGLPRFLVIWSGQAISLVASQVAQFGLVWWLTLKTGSPAVLSTATLLALLPMVALGPAIGALVDRWRRRWTMIVADGAVA